MRSLPGIFKINIGMFEAVLDDLPWRRLALAMRVKFQVVNVPIFLRRGLAVVLVVVLVVGPGGDFPNVIPTHEEGEFRDLARNRV